MKLVCLLGHGKDSVIAAVMKTPSSASFRRIAGWDSDGNTLLNYGPITVAISIPNVVEMAPCCQSPRSVFHVPATVGWVNEASCPLQ